MGCKPGETLPDIEEDDTISWIRKGHYYGMPNLKRGETDPRQCTWRSNNEPSDANYTAPLAIVPSSFDGITEFQTAHFNGQLRGKYVSFVPLTLCVLSFNAFSPCLPRIIQFDRGKIQKRIVSGDPK